MKKQKTEDDGVIIVKNNTFQWHRDSVFENYDLKLVECETKKDKCKNPWSLLNDDETTLVKSLKPEFSAPLQLSCILKKQLLTHAQLLKELSALIAADFWGLFVTNEARTKYEELYNARNEEENEDLRTRWIKNSKSLLPYLENGDTLVVVLGMSFLSDIYISKMQKHYLYLDVQKLF